MNNSLGRIRLGCAGWRLPRAAWPQFPAEGSHLERYAARLNAVEINSSFYRPHQTPTYAKWAASVPVGFSFSVKLPQTITHERRLTDAGVLLDDFLAQISGLGAKLGCLLVQLSPSLAYDKVTTRTFFRDLRKAHSGPVALEARHASWFTAAVSQQLASQGVPRSG